jgi:hypothetical protein
MRTIISGQAGTAFVLDGEESWSIDVHDPDTRVPRRPSECALVFADASDLQFLENVSGDDVVRRLQEAVDNDEALYLALMIFDDKVDDDIRADAIPELEELLKQESVETYVQNVLFARPLPEGVDAEWTLRLVLRFCLSRNISRVLCLLGGVVSLRSIVKSVRDAWERIPPKLFASEDYRSHCRAVFVRQGMFRRLVQAIAQGEALGEFRLEGQLNPEVKKLRNHVQIFSRWTASFGDRGLEVVDP